MARSFPASVFEHNIQCVSWNGRTETEKMWKTEKFKNNNSSQSGQWKKFDKELKMRWRKRKEKIETIYIQNRKNAMQ